MNEAPRRREPLDPRWGRIEVALGYMLLSDADDVDVMYRDVKDDLRSLQREMETLRIGPDTP